MSPHILRRWVGMGLALLGPTWASSALAQNLPSLVINDVTVAEGNSGSTLATFTVSFADSTPHGAVFVSFTISAGTATTGSQCGTAGVDYVGLPALAVSLTFSASEFSEPINVTVCGDMMDEPDQTFFVNLYNPRGATIQDPQGQGTIIDDDPPPVLSISDVTVTEGPAGATTTAGFAVTLTGLTANTVTVAYRTVDRSAIGGSCGTAGVDYESKSASITYTNPAPTTQTLAVVLVCGDDVSEGNQQFEVLLGNATNATIQDGTGLVTITDDEPLPTLSITRSVLVSEPSALVPQVSAVFTVTLTGPATEQPVSVAYATAPGTATAGGACTGTIDYITQTGTLTFGAAKSTQQIQVPICADAATIESNETFTVTLVRAANAVITQAVGTATIR